MTKRNSLIMSLTTSIKCQLYSQTCFCFIIWIFLQIFLNKIKLHRNNLFYSSFCVEIKQCVSIHSDQRECLKVKCYHNLVKLSNRGIIVYKTVQKLKFLSLFQVLEARLQIKCYANNQNWIYCSINSKRIIKPIFFNGTVIDLSYTQQLAEEFGKREQH